MSLNLTKPQQFNATSLKPINLFMAGVGSGKTYLAGALSYYFILNFPKIKGMIAANTYLQLTQSTMFRIREVWKVQFDQIEGRDYVVDKKPPGNFNTEDHNYDDYYNIISFENGAVIFKASLDKASAHEGKEVGWCMCDETKDSREQDIKDVILARLRQRGIFINGQGLTDKDTGRSFNPLYIFTSPAKVDWINEWFELDRWEGEIGTKIYEEKDFFRKEFGNKCISISSTLHNSNNVATGYIANMIANHTDREGNLKQSGKRLIYADPFVKAGGEYFSSFDRISHVGDYPFVKGEPIHISYDFNVVPYMTLLCFQIIHREKWWEVRCFDEFCLPSPKNSTEAITSEFRREYIDHLSNGLYYYGDPTGKSRDTRGRRNDYDIIEGVLSRHLNNYSRRVAHRAAPVVQRRDFMNNIFDEKYDIRIFIDRKCSKLIADLEYLKEDIDGKKMKVKVKDPDTGQTYEKYGHCGDALEYFCTEAFQPYFKKFK